MVRARSHKSRVRAAHAVIRGTPVHYGLTFAICGAVGAKTGYAPSVTCRRCTKLLADTLSRRTTQGGEK